MGFNTLVIIHNDCLSDIKKDSTFGQRLFDAAVENYSNGHLVNIPGGVVIDSYHADSLRLVIAGWNTASICGSGFGNPRETEVQLRMLKTWAKSFGYRLARKK